MGQEPYRFDCTKCGTNHGLVICTDDPMPSPVAEATRARYALYEAEIRRFTNKLAQAFDTPPEARYALRQVAKWCVRLPNGKMPARVCEHCGERAGVKFEPGRTCYGACDAGDDPEANRDEILCRECADEHHAHWDSMWADYYSGLL